MPSNWYISSNTLYHIHQIKEWKIKYKNLEIEIKKYIAPQNYHRTDWSCYYDYKATETHIDKITGITSVYQM